jgi:hypothetical protein
MSNLELINDPRHWRWLAHDMRTLAHSLNDDTSKQVMLRVAAEYEHVAKRAQERLRGDRESRLASCFQ